MKRFRLDVRGILILIWIAGLVYALAVAFHFSDFIPHKFSDVIGRVTATYAPQLSVMLAFAFATRGKKSSAAPKSNVAGVLAILVSLIYVGFFSWLVLKFATHQMTAVQLLSNIDQYQPRCGFLVLGMLSYYFGAST